MKAPSVRTRWIVGATVSVAVVLYAASAPLLTFAGEQLVHADPIEPVDVAIVPASGLDRIIEAAALYHDGYAPVIVLMREQPDPAHEFLASRGIQIENTMDQRRRVLSRLGVPLSAVVVLDGVAGSTADEARAFGEWARTHPIRSVMIVTSPSHTARCRLTFRRILRDIPVRVLMRPSSMARFRGDSWWRSRDTLREGLYEWQKLVYYRLFEVWRLTPVVPEIPASS